MFPACYLLACSSNMDMNDKLQKIILMFAPESSVFPLDASSTNYPTETAHPEIHMLNTWIDGQGYLEVLQTPTLSLHRMTNAYESFLCISLYLMLENTIWFQF